MSQSATLAPTTTGEVVEAVRWALSAQEPLEVVGGGTKRAVSEPAQAGHTLDLSGLSGIIAYEPEELVLTVRPGTPLAELTDTLAERGQMFAFEPPDLGPLLRTEGTATFGGTFASNLAGPRRLAAGAVRDHMLGLEAVSGRGEVFRAGGRVVKNVTGYDLARALCGSWGTLAVATELTVKVAPKPETEATLLFSCEEAIDAVDLLARAMGSSADVSGAAHVPAAVCGDIPHAKGAVAAVRLEGFGPSVKARRQALVGLLGEPRAVLEPEPSLEFWRAVRNVAPFANEASAVWRCSVAPSEGPRLAAAAPSGSRALFDWAGGLAWLSVPAEGDAGAAAIRGAIGQAGGGHATLFRAPLSLRAGVPTFHPVADGLQALSARLRGGFDPHAILNPGRMARGAASRK